MRSIQCGCCAISSWCKPHCWWQSWHCYELVFDTMLWCDNICCIHYNQQYVLKVNCSAIPNYVSIVVWACVCVRLSSSYSQSKITSHWSQKLKMAITVGGLSWDLYGQLSDKNFEWLYIELFPADMVIDWKKRDWSLFWNSAKNCLYTDISLIPYT